MLRAILNSASKPGLQASAPTPRPRPSVALPKRPQPATPSSRRGPHGFAALLVGFPQSEAEAGAAILRAAGWDRVLTDGGRNVLRIIEREPVELVVIDVDHCDDYAPRLIADMRRDMGADTQTRIIALAMILPDGLSRQLRDAGAHQVLSKRGGEQSGDWIANLP
ncbi:hypothetical protein [Jannaschia sp. CCS1]|uniref:hypothetical protein n=1 Tax=Jannaschia sp. (strain CCS1) TaxID=290400 RepID=UPI000053B803|nr:hypothetical protein [Jannaschia sp. CCS1]ABD54069.1 hypothetical protein Jann_1152 [Jannaschia sp. CCS1]